MKILITGATGFVGSWVLKQLLEKYNDEDIIALSSKPLNVKTILHNNYDFNENYLLKNGCEDVEVILHIGAFTPKNGKEANFISENNNNVRTTEIISKSNLPNLKKIIFISTLDIYAACEVINENSPTNPISLYGWSKLYCEEMIKTFAKEKNLTYQVLRLGHVFGEGEEKYQKILPLTIKKVINNEEIQIWGDGQAIRTFIYIEDVAKAIINSINLETSNIINIVGEEKITIKKLVEKIIRISGKEIKINYIKTNTPNRNLIFDNTLLKNTLLPDLVTLDEGLLKEYHYMEKL